MRAKLVLALASVTLMGLVSPDVAHAAEPPNEQFTVIVRGRISNGEAETTSSVVVAHGVVDAVGRDEFQPSQPGDPANVDRDVFVFPDGALLVRVTNLSFSGGEPDQNTCIATFGQRGSWDITGGTGAYMGATGTASFILRGTGVATRLPHGDCGDDARFILVSTATGNLSIPMR
jgi:hypothetical protein